MKWEAALWTVSPCLKKPVPTCSNHPTAPNSSHACTGVCVRPVYICVYKMSATLAARSAVSPCEAPDPFNWLGQKGMSAGRRRLRCRSWVPTSAASTVMLTEAGPRFWARALSHARRPLTVRPPAGSLAHWSTTTRTSPGFARNHSKRETASDHYR
ncbi:hypothetical protein GCM10010464_27650 [Pseudonocardia yunnanensis]